MHEIYFPWDAANPNFSMKHIEWVLVKKYSSSVIWFTVLYILKFYYSLTCFENALRSQGIFTQFSDFKLYFCLLGAYTVNYMLFIYYNTLKDLMQDLINIM